ncbi:TetR/AcrR family transcriptional regulator [Mycolicibacillus koreensis]|uniref:TetR/AcrR family transcriptional regulator n=1 Tax=Mycolicibacillus koreensis TaxID=1069220 RepID=UPI0008490E6E|nr:TetR/AcrR family transcriptional regulator [Mycolicibacillus koreensis]ODR11842.1 TetR family transcriptional regulator [Mycolicibacillus koreensis]BBY55562.1 TetR family transcriptional regulator [Mycolicibacillus koreensis]
MATDQAVDPVASLPTERGRQTRAAIDAAARTLIARQGVLATTIADIAAASGRSAASFYNYYDSKEDMLRQWAERFRDEAAGRAAPINRSGLSNWDRAHHAAAAHWHTYRHRTAEMIGIWQLAMVNEDFADYWAEICAIPIAYFTETVRRAQRDGYCRGDDPRLLAEALVAMFNQFCFIQLGGPRGSNGPGGGPDDEACIATLAHIVYRAIYCPEGARP